MSKTTKRRGVKPQSIEGTQAHEDWLHEQSMQVEAAQEAAADKLTEEAVRNLLKPYEPPAKVRGKNARPGMVGDAAPSEIYGMGAAMGLAASNPTLAQMAHEGIGFPGYPYLSALALRGEYQNIVGIREREFFRKWGHFQSRSGNSDKIKAKVEEIEKEMERLEVRQNLRQSFKNDENFGNGFMTVLWDGDAENEEELESVLPSGPELKGKLIERLQVVEPVWITPDTYEAWNPLRKDFYIPQHWWVMGKRVHISRITQIIQRPMHDLFKQAFNFGGLPITLMAKPYVDNWLRNRQNVPDIINTLRVFVVKEDLTLNASGLKTAGAPNGRGKTLNQALRSWQRTMDNFGILALSKDGGLDVKTTPLSDLHDLLGQSLEQICCITNIPVIKFTTNQPAGLNATSDGTIRTFYDTGRAIRENDIQPSLMRIVDLIQLTLWGEIDEDIEWIWDDLYEETPADKLDMESKKADIRASDCQNGFITADEGREQLRGDPDSIYAAANVELTGSAVDMTDYPGDGDGPPANVKQALSTKAEQQQDGSREATVGDSFQESQHPRDEDGKFSGSGSLTSGKKFTPTQRQYLEWYSEQGFSEINSSLRNGTASKGMIDSISGAMDRSKLDTDATLYRVIEADHLKEMLGKDIASRGDVFSDKAIASTTTKVIPGIGSGSVLLKINAKKGQKAIDMKGISSNQQENEVLLPPGQKMKIVRISAPSSETGNKVVMHIDLEE